MDLRRRLARLDQLTQRPQPPPEPLAVTTDPEHTLVRELGLVRQETSAGPLWLRQDRRERIPAVAGPVADLGGVLSVPAPAQLQWSEVLFLDTETTGLAGGTGTLAFLIGLAWWQEDGFHVRQLMLPGPGREGPVLAELGRLASGFRVVATYNGASFDLPLLRTRARLNRRDDPLAHLSSWDLLVGTRRCWGRGLADCRQQTIEARICGLVRGDGDIAGERIPATYQQFLQTGAAGELPAVLRHNRRDMDGMASILLVLADETRQLGAEVPESTSWPVVWSRALLAERRREPRRAGAWARALTAPGCVAEADPGAIRDGIRLLKRVGDVAAVAELVTAGLARWPQARWLHYEAAVLYEHRLGDLRQALAHAERLGDRHRCVRLHRRLARADGCSGAAESV